MRIALWLPNLHFFFIQKPLKCRKTALQNNFSTWTCWRHQLRLCGKLNIWVCFWLICKGIKKDMTPYLYNCLCVYLLPVLLIQRLLIAVLLLIKLKIKKCITHSSIWMHSWKHNIFLALHCQNALLLLYVCTITHYVLLLALETIKFLKAKLIIANFHQ